MVTLAMVEVAKSPAIKSLLAPPIKSVGKPNRQATNEHMPIYIFHY